MGGWEGGRVGGWEGGRVGGCGGAAPAMLHAPGSRLAAYSWQAAIRLRPTPDLHRPRADGSRADGPRGGAWAWVLGLALCDSSPALHPKRTRGARDADHGPRRIDEERVGLGLG